METQNLRIAEGMMEACARSMLRTYGRPGVSIDVAYVAFIVRSTCVPYPLEFSRSSATSDI